MSSVCDGRNIEQIRRVSTVWKSYLYQLQQQAPKPAAVLCTDRPPDCPPYYGLEYHGSISHLQSQDKLTMNGSYLVRRSEKAEGFYTLSMRFSNNVKHYKLYYDGKHYVGEKRFDTLHDLVADGLITLYLEDQAGDYINNMSRGSYLNSPHYTLTRSMRLHIHTGRTLPRQLPQSNKEVHKEEFKSIIYGAAPPDCVEDVNLNIEQVDVTTQRPHRFHVNTFTGLHWCGFCGHFLWGFVSQGVKCQDCSFKAHKQCSYKVPNDCCPDLKDLQSIFGADLTTSLSIAGSTDNVPKVVLDCVAEVEARGLTTEGIYRVPGSQDQIETLRLAFERDGDRVSLNEKAVPDINVVAGVLKLYLRLLPIPLITTQCFNRLIGTCKLTDQEARVSSIRDALITLPPAHYATLKVIITHLGRVCEHSAVNKMTATSLSTCFAPTLVQTAAPTDQLQPADLLALANAAQEPRVVEALIIFHPEVFQ
ncbi:N-chimaerin-like [Macrobrachium nipponense]|uniref:N-chimaerin-like n=1 Tax=Macrobrachium nipponense TaxID=159736 RepID=UPI0030C8A13B